MKNIQIILSVSQIPFRRLGILLLHYLNLSMDRE